MASEVRDMVSAGWKKLSVHHLNAQGVHPGGGVGVGLGAAGEPAHVVDGPPRGRGQER